MKVLRISSRPASAIDSAPTKLSAISNPNSSSITRSSGLRMGSRASCAAARAAAFGPGFAGGMVCVVGLIREPRGHRVDGSAGRASQ